MLPAIEDPLRRAALTQAVLHRIATFRTPCCRRVHCFNCHVNGGHPGLTCEQYQARRRDENGIGPDADIISCPKCYVPLIKSEGCNAVVCPCGQSFDYARRKRELELAKMGEFESMMELTRGEDRWLAWLQVGIQADALAKHGTGDLPYMAAEWLKMNNDDLIARLGAHFASASAGSVVWLPPPPGYQYMSSPTPALVQNVIHPSTRWDSARMQSDARFMYEVIDLGYEKVRGGKISSVVPAAGNRAEHMGASWNTSTAMLRRMQEDAENRQQPATPNAAGANTEQAPADEEESGPRVVNRFADSLISHQLLKAVRALAIIRKTKDVETPTLEIAGASVWITRHEEAGQMEKRLDEYVKGAVNIQKELSALSTEEVLGVDQLVTSLGVYRTDAVELIAALRDVGMAGRFLKTHCLPNGNRLMQAVLLRRSMRRIDLRPESPASTVSSEEMAVADAPLGKAPAVAESTAGNMCCFSPARSLASSSTLSSNLTTPRGTSPRPSRVCFNPATAEFIEYFDAEDSTCLDSCDEQSLASWSAGSCMPCEELPSGAIPRRMSAPVGTGFSPLQVDQPSGGAGAGGSGSGGGASSSGEAMRSIVRLTDWAQLRMNKYGATHAMVDALEEHLGKRLDLVNSLEEEGDGETLYQLRMSGLTIEDAYDILVHCGRESGELALKVATAQQESEKDKDAKADRLRREEIEPIREYLNNLDRPDRRDTGELISLKRPPNRCLVIAEPLLILVTAFLKVDGRPLHSRGRVWEDFRNIIQRGTGDDYFGGVILRCFNSPTKPWLTADVLAKVKGIVEGEEFHDASENAHKVSRAMDNFCKWMEAFLKLEGLHTKRREVEKPAVRRLRLHAFREEWMRGSAPAAAP